MAEDLLPFMRSDAEAFQHGKSVTAGGCRPGKQAGRPHAEESFAHSAIIWQSLLTNSAASLAW